jgi:hypothetical protein
LQQPRARKAARLAGILVACVIVVSACDDDGPPGDPPADTVTGDGSVTTVPAETPSDGSAPIEPGTNQTPSSDEVPGPTGSGVLDTGATTGTTGG